MAYYQNADNLHALTNDAFNNLYGPHETVEFSGIYRCICGNFEAACNKGDPFPPHRPDCGAILWQLIVATQDLTD